MAAATFTLTGDLAALVGSATKRGAYVQLDRPVTDPTNDIVYEMTSRTTVEGSFSLPTLPALNALNNSGAAFNMVVTIGSRKWLVPAQSAASTHDLTEFTETTGVVPPDPITYALRAPDYVTGRAYIVGELVTYSGTLYRITTAYTSSGGSLDLTKATAIGGGGSTGQPLQAVATTVTASGAAVANKHNPADATAAARTISLPTGQAEGTQISVEKVDSSINTVAITGNIRGVAATTISLSYQSESLMLRADSAGSWWPIAGHRTKSTLDAAYLPTTYLLAARPTATGSKRVIFVSDVAGGQLQQDTAASTWTPLAPGASQGALGLIASASVTANVTGIGTTATDITGLSVTWTAVAGATYWVHAKFFVGNTTTATTTTGYLTDSANAVVDTGSYLTRSANDSQIMVYQTFITPAAGSTTYKARLKSSAGSTAFVLGDPTYPARLNVFRVA